METVVTKPQLSTQIFKQPIDEQEEHSGVGQSGTLHSDVHRLTVTQLLERKRKRASQLGNKRIEVMTVVLTVVGTDTIDSGGGGAHRGSNRYHRWRWWWRR